MGQGNLGAALFTDKPLERNSVLLVTLAVAALLLGFGLDHRPRLLWGLVLVGPLVLIGLYDLVQTHHSLRRNYPLTARARWFFEWLRPFLRAYIVESDLDGRPFSHDDRELVYARAHAAEDAHPFGTELDVYSGEYEWLAHSMAPRQAAPGRDQGDGRRRPVHEALSGVAAQHLRDELRRALGQCDRGAELGREDRRLLSRYRRGRAFALSSQAWRRHRLGDRLGLFRLPRRQWPVRSRTLQRSRRARPGEDDRDQAQPGRQARPWRAASRRQGQPGDRRDARRCRGLRLPVAGLPFGLHHAARAGRVRGAAARARRRQADRDQALRRLSARIVRGGEGDARRAASISISSSSTARRAAPAPRPRSCRTASACRCARG